MMFQVEDEQRKFLLIAPLHVLTKIFDLSPGAIRRIEVETVNGKACDLHFESASAPWPTVYVTRLPLEIPLRCPDPECEEPFSPVGHGSCEAS